MSDDEAIPEVADHHRRRVLTAALTGLGGAAAATLATAGTASAASSGGGAGTFESLSVSPASGGTLTFDGSETIVPAEFEDGLTVYAEGGGNHPVTAIVVQAVNNSTGLRATADEGEAAVFVSKGPVLSVTQPAGGGPTYNGPASLDAVTIAAAGTARALAVEQTNTANSHPAAAVLNAGTGPAIYAQNTTPSHSAAVQGVSSAPDGYAGRFDGGRGRGGSFSGAQAQLHLSPGSAPSHPAVGTLGDFYLDARERLWFCKGGRTWKQLA